MLVVRALVGVLGLLQGAAQAVRHALELAVLEIDPFLEATGVGITLLLLRATLPELLFELVDALPGMAKGLEDGIDLMIETVEQLAFHY
jgi:hypothetical protein